jgi:hypothetical protein
LDVVPIDLDTPLSGNPATKNAAIVWPRAIDARLDYLLSLVAQKHRTDRRELAAAILLGVSADPDVLGGLLDAYRNATTRQALAHLETAKDSRSKVIELPKHKPGPRPSQVG